MSCPFFIPEIFKCSTKTGKEDYSGVCFASKVPYIPSIAEMERYCFNLSYKSCSAFKSVHQVKDKTNFGDIREKVERANK